MRLRVTVLGSGTSSGIPEIGCRCGVCSSEDPRDRRFRTAVRLDLPAGVALIDTPADLRHQALAFGLDRLDAVLWTHFHADHVLGIDELRAYNRRQRRPLPGYGSRATLEEIRRSFAYIFAGGGGRPQLELTIVDGPFPLLGAEVVPVPLLHRDLEVFGYRIGPFAYCTDCNHVPEASLELLQGLSVLILDGLRFRPHPTHFTIPEAVEVAARIGADRTYLTHLSHEVEHAAVSAGLPPGVELAHDGLVLEL